MSRSVIAFLIISQIDGIDHVTFCEIHSIKISVTVWVIAKYTEALGMLHLILDKPSKKWIVIIILMLFVHSGIIIYSGQGILDAKFHCKSAMPHINFFIEAPASFLLFYKAYKQSLLSPHAKLKETSFSVFLWSLCVSFVCSMVYMEWRIQLATTFDRLFRLWSFSKLISVCLMSNMCLLIFCLYLLLCHYLKISK